MDVGLECEICTQSMTVDGVDNVATVELLMTQWCETHGHSEEERAAHMRESWAGAHSNEDGDD